ncbi:MAG: GTP-binding protein [Leptospira sp.]|nr:GTP-binding protein [Leptospira sp.]
MGIFAHIDAGKTTLVERILFECGAIQSPGSIEDGTTETDFLSEEIRRGISIQSAIIQVFHTFQNNKFTINIIDTPGHLDFEEQVNASLHIIDFAVLLIDVTEGVKTQTEIIFEKLKKNSIPVIYFLNKTDKGISRVSECIAEIEKLISGRLSPLFNFKKNNPEKVEFIFRKDLRDDPALLPFLEWSEELSAGYLQEPARIAELARLGFSKGFSHLQFSPVLAGSGLTGEGSIELLNCICLAEVSSSRREKHRAGAVGLIFKRQIHPELGRLSFFYSYKSLNAGQRVWSQEGETELSDIYLMNASKYSPMDKLEPYLVAATTSLSKIPVGSQFLEIVNSETFPIPEATIPKGQFGIVIEPKDGDKREKLLQALENITWEDQALSISISQETGHIELHGAGELHLEVSIARLKESIGDIFSVGKLRVSRYEKWIKNIRDTIFEHSIQDGKFRSGIIKASLEKANDFTKSVFFNQELRAEFREAIVSGFEEVMSHGNFNCEILGVNFRIHSLEMPMEDSSLTPVLIKIAVISFLKNALPESTQQIGPVSEIEVIVPTTSMGIVLSELERRSAKIFHTEKRWDGKTLIKGEVSTENVLGFTEGLRNMTKGKGFYTVNTIFSSLKCSIFN